MKKILIGLLLLISCAVSVFAAPRYYVDPNGIVHSAGVVSSGTITGPVSASSLNQIKFVSAYSSFNAAITAIGSTPTTLYLDVATSLTATTVVPSTLSIQGSINGTITKVSGSLTINGPFSAGLYQVFIGFSAGDVMGLKEVRPEWYGAVGDGVTEDTTAFTLMSASTQSNTSITLSGATYIVRNNGFKITGASNVRINGNGSTLLAPTTETSTTTYFVMWIESCTNVIIENITFNRRSSYSASKPVAGHREDAIYIYISNGITVRHCNFDECNTGVYVSDSPNVIIDGNTMTGRLPYTASDDINVLLAKYLGYVYDSSGHISHGGRFTNNYAEKVNNMIYNEDGDHWIISNNVSKDGGDSQLYIKGSGNSITGNTITDPGKDGIKVLSNVGGEKTTITGNIIKRPGKNKSDGGIGIIITGVNNVVIGNFIELADPAVLASPNTVGIVSESTGGLISGNIITGPGASINTVSGIKSIINLSIYTGVKESMLVTSNLISDVYYGIVLAPTTDQAETGTTISNNLLNNVYYGIYGDGVSGDKTKLSYLTISGNSIRSSSTSNTSALIVVNASNVLVSNNTISAANSTGMRATTCNKVLFYNNTVFGGGTGLYIDSDNTDIRVRGNTFIGYVNFGLRFIAGATYTVEDYSFVTAISSAPSYTGQMSIVGTTGYLATGVTTTTDWQKITP